MDNLKLKKEKEEEQTASAVIQSKESKKRDGANEEVLDFSRGGREMFRVVISKESNDALETVLKKCTDGFDSGSISKSDIANYVFQNLNKFFQDSDIKSLRAAHFDEKKMLSSMLKNESDLPLELRQAIRAHFGITAERDKKRPSKSSEII